ncbi:MAG TPA: PAS domain-containing sensor histidine kinase [Agriterribacter sp.]|nr:PAS domain-containing sensor histidine kinase [Agriterribacter sp.]
MINFNSRQATFYAIIIFIITVVLGYYFPGRAFISSGMLVAIFLTIFIRQPYATIIAGAVSLCVAAVYPIIHQYQTGIFTSVTENLFVILLIFCCSLLAWYIKSILAHLQFDRSHMSSLFENATEGILLTDSKGAIILANPSAEQIFGYEKEELIDQKVEQLIPSKFQAHHANLRAGFYKAPSNRTMGSGRDLYALRKDGSEFPVEVSLSHYKQNNEQFVIAFVVDITARKDIERRIQHKQQELENITQEIQSLNTQLEAKVEERTVILKEALEKLEESQLELSEALKKERQLNELKSRFVSMASHEFRTPLSTIYSSATLVSKYPLEKDSEKRTNHINKIKDSVRHMNELLEDFLSLGKLEENKMSVAVEAFAAREFIEEVVEEMRVQTKTGQEIKSTYQGESIFTTDKRLLRNTLINLLSNAIKFSGENAPIYISVSNEQNQIVICIRDNGIGIPTDDMPHLFDTFFRAKNANNIQGTGLGLPIIKRYLQLLEGSIEVKSELQKGAEFTITLPALQ